MVYCISVKSFCTYMHAYIHKSLHTYIHVYTHVLFYINTMLTEMQVLRDPTAVLRRRRISRARKRTWVMKTTMGLKWCWHWELMCTIDVNALCGRRVSLHYHVWPTGLIADMYSVKSCFSHPAAEWKLEKQHAAIAMIVNPFAACPSSSSGGWIYLTKYLTSVTTLHGASIWTLPHRWENFIASWYLGVGLYHDFLGSRYGIFLVL